MLKTIGGVIAGYLVNPIIGAIGVMLGARLKK